MIVASLYLRLSDFLWRVEIQIESELENFYLIIIMSTVIVIKLSKTTLFDQKMRPGLFIQECVACV